MEWKRGNLLIMLLDDIKVNQTYGKNRAIDNLYVVLEKINA